MPAMWITPKPKILSSLLLLIVLTLSHPCLAAEESAGNLCAGDLPGQVDLRDALKTWMLAPRLQGAARGTCSVFTVAAAMEYAQARRQNQGQHLSVEYLNWASNQAVGVVQDGGFFSDLWKGYQAHGICPEQAMPYQNTFDPNIVPDETAKQQAAQSLKNSPLQMHWIKQWNPHTGLTDKELTDIKCVLSRNWPVCGGFRWPKQVRWNNNILNMPPPEGVFDGHSVLLVGYRDDPEQPGGGVFVIRNSNKPGDKDWMTYAYVKAYMNDAIWIETK